jgi:hypothetical protein
MVATSTLFVSEAWEVVPQASAASVRTGPCLTNDANAVSIVIDYQSLGGGTLQYCVSNLANGSTGMDVLRTVASVQGTTHDGGSFVCRINNRPGPSESITLPNGESYMESCVNTPPGSAYWVYWHADAGGSWTYSSQGANSRRVKFGSYEGWSFALGAAFGSGPRPGISPAFWADPPKPPTTEAPPPPPPPPPVTSHPPVVKPSSTQGAKPASDTTAGDHPTQSRETPTDSVSPSVVTATASTAGTPSSAQLSPRETEVPDEKSGGVPWGVILALGLILANGVVAGIVWYRRRSGVA